MINIRIVGVKNYQCSYKEGMLEVTYLFSNKEKIKVLKEDYIYRNFDSVVKELNFI